MNWKRYVKFILIAAGIAALLGMILMICGWAMGAKDGFIITKNGFQLIDRNAAPQQAQTPNTPAAPQEQDIDAFHSIRLHIGDSSLTFVKADRYGISLEPEADGTSAFQVVNGVLTNQKTEGQLSWQFPNTGANQQTITIFYPENADFRSIEIDADGGNIQLSDITANQISIEQDSGEITLSNLITNRLSAESDSGSITVEGALAGKTELESDTGNIAVHASQAEQAYRYNCMSETGEIFVNGVSTGRRIAHGNSSENQWDIQSEHGTITLDFAK